MSGRRRRFHPPWSRPMAAMMVVPVAVPAQGQLNPRPPIRSRRVHTGKRRRRRGRRQSGHAGRRRWWPRRSSQGYIPAYIRSALSRQHSKGQNNAPHHSERQFSHGHLNIFHHSDHHGKGHVEGAALIVSRYHLLLSFSSASGLRYVFQATRADDIRKKRSSNCPGPNAISGTKSKGSTK